MPLPPPPTPRESPGGPPHGLPQPTGRPVDAPAAAMTCFRHPDRTAGRRCTRCGKPACPSCLVQATVGSHCVDCAKASRPDIKTRARFWSAGQHHLVTTALIAVNLAVFVGVALWTRDAGALSSGVTDAHLQLGLSRDVLAQPITWTGGGEVYLTEPDGWYRLVTSGFLHFGILHLALNMYFLYVLGPMLERPLGRVRYVLLYFASLLGGSLGVILLDSGGISAGASGAVFGLLAAAAVGLWRQGVNPFTTSIGTVLLLNLFITFAVPGISIGGHVGGAIAGALCASVMLAPAYRAAPTWLTYAVPAAVIAASVAGSALLVTAA